MLEEIFNSYGKVIITAIIILALIAVAIIFRDQIPGWFTSLVNNYMTQLNQKAGLATPTP